MFLKLSPVPDLLGENLLLSRAGPVTLALPGDLDSDVSPRSDFSAEVDVIMTAGDRMPHAVTIVDHVALRELRSRRASICMPGRQRDRRPVASADFRSGKSAPRR